MRLRLATSGEFDGRADAIVVGFCADQFDAQTVIRSGGALRLIPEKIDWAAIRRKQQIQPAIVVDIGVGGATAHAGKSESWAE